VGEEVQPRLTRHCNAFFVAAVRSSATACAARTLALVTALFFSVSPLPATAASLTLQWNQGTGSTSGYLLSYGTSPGTYNTTVDVGQQTRYVISGLTSGTRYYFSVKAYNPQGVSPPSNEATAVAPASGGTPVLTNPGNQSSVVNGSVQLQLVASDPDNDPLTFSASSLPAGLTVNSTTGLIAGTPTSPGTYNVTVNVTDGYVVATHSFVWTIAPAPAAGDGLVSHWRFDETTGTVAAEATGRYPGRLMNGAGWTPGYSGYAVALNGSGAFVDAGTFDLSGSETTIAAWIKSTDLSSGYDRRFISKASGVAEDLHYWMLSTTTVNGAPRLRFRLRTGTTTTTLIASSGNLPLNTWYHAAATYDGTTMRLYLNGVLVGSTAKSGAIATNPSIPVNIGRNPDGGGYTYHHGAIDDVRLYSRALSSSEIAAAAGPAPPPPPPPANRAPVVTAPAAQTSHTDDTISLAITASDPDGDPLTFSASGLPAGLRQDATTGRITGTFVSGSAGSYTVNLTVGDGRLTATASFSWTVILRNRPPVIANPGNQVAKAGPFSLAMSATDPDGDALAFAAAGLPAGLQITAAGVIQGTAPAGSFTVTVTASDGKLSASTTFGLSVTANSGPTLSAVADQSTNVGALATLQLSATDADADPLRFSASNLPPGLTLNADTGRIDGRPSTAGTYAVTAEVTDGALVAARSFQWTVTAVSQPGLVGHWKFDEDGGTSVADDIGGRIGTLVNGPQWTTGVFGAALRFDGINDYVALPFFDIAGSGLSISAWVRNGSQVTKHDQRFISKATNVSENAHYWLLGTAVTNAGPRLRFRLKTGSTTTTLIAYAGTLPIDGWYHAAATYDGAVMRLYFNGQEVGSTPKTGAVAQNPSVPVNIGRNPNGPQVTHLHGSLDDLRIFDRGLTAAEVRQVMTGEQGSAPSGP
jgi:hypothetical protein